LEDADAALLCCICKDGGGGGTLPDRRTRLSLDAEVSLVKAPSVSAAVGCVLLDAEGGLPSATVAGGGDKGEDALRGFTASVAVSKSASVMLSASGWNGGSRRPSACWTAVMCAASVGDRE
jgi:hypothetical protein